MMVIRIETASYNVKRYGRPWIAMVDFRKSTKGEYSWGEWTGEHYTGGDGVLTITADPGDIIATGQKDNRQPRNSAPNFYVVGVDGKLEEIGDKGAAYKHYLEHKTVTPDHAALAKERETLLTRIAEINAIIGS